jgi:hypothetical protein
MFPRRIPTPQRDEVNSPWLLLSRPNLRARRGHNALFDPKFGLPAGVPWIHRREDGEGIEAPCHRVQVVWLIQYAIVLHCFLRLLLACYSCRSGPSARSFDRADGGPGTLPGIGRGRVAILSSHAVASAWMTIVNIEPIDFMSSIMSRCDMPN